MLSTSVPNLVAIQEEEQLMHIIMEENWKTISLSSKTRQKPNAEKTENCHWYETEKPD